MRLSPRFAVTALAVSLALLAGCNKTGDEAKVDDKTEAAAIADPEAIPGPPTEKDRHSYMVGMAPGRHFEPMTDETALDVVVNATPSTIAGGKRLKTVEQDKAIRAAIPHHLQA